MQMNGNWDYEDIYIYIYGRSRLNDSSSLITSNAKVDGGRFVMSLRPSDNAAKLIPRVSDDKRYWERRVLEQSENVIDREKEDIRKVTAIWISVRSVEEGGAGR